MFNLMILSFTLYFLMLLAIGIYFRRHTRNEAEFALGNRSLNYWAVALSAQNSDMSGWIFLAYPTLIFLGGLFDAWIAVGLVSCMFVSWQFLAPKIREATEKYQAITLWTFLERRFNDDSGKIRIACTFISIFFFTIYVAAGLLELGVIFNAAFGMDRNLGTLIGMLVIIAYTAVGGFLAVAWSNLIQALFLLAVIVTVPVVGYFYVGGASAIIAAAQAQHISLAFIPTYGAVIIALLKAAGWGLGYFGMPHVIVNFMGIDNVSNMRKAKVVGLSWQIAILAAAIGIGLVGIAFFPQGLSEPQHLFPLMATTLFSPLVAGFIFCGVLSATLATVSSQILVSASALSEDFYKTLWPHTSQQQLLFVPRSATVLMGVIGATVAWYSTTCINTLVFYAWSGLGSAFSAPIMLALYGNLPLNRHGILSGIVVGTLVSALWPMAGCTWFPAETSLVAGCALNALTAWFVSQVTAPRSF